MERMAILEATVETVEEMVVVTKIEAGGLEFAWRP